MTIELNATYLGKSENSFTGQDGKPTSYSTLNFYDYVQNEFFSLNVVHGPSTSELVNTVGAMLSNEKCKLMVRLVPKDKLYRMQLLDISA